jgi:hypothetical protein
MSVKSVIQDYRRLYNAVNKMSGGELDPTVNADVALVLLSTAEKRIKQQEALVQLDRIAERLFGVPASNPPAPESELAPDESGEPKRDESWDDEPDYVGYDETPAPKVEA